MVTVPPDSPISREAFELLREAYSETEVWKIAQLAATLVAGTAGPNADEAVGWPVKVARALLAEARRQVAANPGAA